MSRHARELHRELDRQFAEAWARDGPKSVPDGNVFPDLARPRRWRRDLIVSRPSEPRVLLMRLSQRTSGKGRPYLSGWLGKARVVAFEGAEDQYGNATWDLYVAEPREAEDRPRQGDRGS
jgi:hypothetical protein